MYQVDMETLEPRHVIALAHKGPYTTISGTYKNLFELLAEQQVAAHGRPIFGIYYDDPTQVPEAQLRSCACVVKGEADKISAPLIDLTIAGGEYAILRHKGPYETLMPAYQWFYGQWLQEQGRQYHPSEPCFEHYLNSPMDTAPEELRTDIYMLLAEQ